MGEASTAMMVENVEVIEVVDHTCTSPSIAVGAAVAPARLQASQLMLDSMTQLIDGPTLPKSPQTAPADGLVMDSQFSTSRLTSDCPSFPTLRGRSSSRPRRRREASACFFATVGSDIVSVETRSHGIRARANQQDGEGLASQQPPSHAGPSKVNKTLLSPDSTTMRANRMSAFGVAPIAAPVASSVGQLPPTSCAPPPPKAAALTTNVGFYCRRSPASSALAVRRGSCECTVCCSLISCDPFSAGYAYHDSDLNCESRPCGVHWCPPTLACEPHSSGSVHFDVGFRCSNHTSVASYDGELAHSRVSWSCISGMALSVGACMLTLDVREHPRRYRRTLPHPPSFRRLVVMMTAT